MEKTFAVTPVFRAYECDKCGRGMLQALPPKIQGSAPPTSFPHACTACGEIMYLPKPFPQIDYQVHFDQEVIDAEKKQLG